MLNLDTHILVRALEGALAPAERLALSRQRWGISAIVLWEIAKLSQLGRIAINLDTPELVQLLRHVQVWPIDLAVCRALSELDFRGDPADELIAATSIVYGVPLVTRDRVLRRSRRVPLA
jgi:PIN domain nuclease of toxin-antitoxin system